MASGTYIQGRIARFLRHRYTWQQRVDDPDAEPGEVDDWGNPLRVATSPPGPAPTPNKPCLFTDTNRVTISTKVALGGVGPIQLEVNELVVPWDDPIRIGDYVLSITDPETGLSLIPEPARVEIISDVGPHGAIVYRVATLRGPEVE